MCWYVNRRSSKPRNRPSFRQIQMHLEIATPEWLNIPGEEFFQLQVLFSLTVSLWVC